jgi:hypothetical protein
MLRTLPLLLALALTACDKGGADSGGATAASPDRPDNTGGPGDFGGPGGDQGDDSGIDGGASGDDTDRGGDSGDPGVGPGDDGGDDGGGEDTAPAGPEPPLGQTSGGSGGGDYPSATSTSADGSDYQLLAPGGSSSGSALCLLIVISGTEGASTMMSNMRQVAPYFGMGDCLVAVLDGRYASAEDGAAVLDDLRALYDVDNDRTWLLSESAGTRAGLELGLELRQSWFAAYWANDVNASGTPALHADALGFAPWGNAGPGGDWPDAEAIVAGMEDAGYRLPSDAPYSGPGSDSHGSTDQFLSAVDFFADKRRE